MNQEQSAVEYVDSKANIQYSDKSFTDAEEIDNNICNNGELSTKAVDSFSLFSHSDNMSPTTEHYDNSAASPSPTEDDSSDDSSDDTLPEALPQANDIFENNTEVETLSQHVIKHAWNNNFSAPVGQILENGATVLDVGCGSGAWLQDMAITYPKSKFIGADLIPAPQSQIPNITFVHGDILAGLPFPDNNFDFVTQRFLSIKFSDVEWRTQVIAELVRVTKPGGWIELMECDFELVNSGNETKRIIAVLKQHYLPSKNINVNLAHELHEYLAGNNNLQQVGRETRDIESGGTTIIAQRARNDYGNFLMSVRDDLADHMKMSYNHYNALWEVIHNEMKRLNTKRSTHRVYAQKKEL